MSKKGGGALENFGAEVGESSPKVNRHRRPVGDKPDDEQQQHQQ
jgi:hypothetical protein